MQFELLNYHHDAKLLAFELANKQWFESLIEARPNTFYSLEGIEEHIKQLDVMHKLGKSRSYVVLQEDEIVARANLKDISQGSAAVGYRVAHQKTSMGLGKRCLSHLIYTAKESLMLSRLHAQVLDNNPASLHLLQKAGFVKTRTIQGFLSINNQRYSCHELSYNLKND